jgi:hypothetical protein
MDEAKSYGFKNCPLIMSLDDGSEIYSITDHDATDGGELAHIKNGKYITIPAMWSEE